MKLWHFEYLVIFFFWVKLYVNLEWKKLVMQIKIDVKNV